MTSDLVVQRPEGLYCPAGDFHIDPMRPVPRAVITHAHADHARRGHGAYLAAADGAGVLRLRLGDIRLQTVSYGEQVDIGGVRVSLHPAGHVLGSAQDNDPAAVDPVSAKLVGTRAANAPPGKLRFVADRYGNATEYHYDAAGHLDYIKDPVGLRTSFERIADADADLCLADHLRNTATWCLAEKGAAQQLDLQAMFHPLLGQALMLVDADAAVACCVGPTLLGTRNAAGSDASDRIHDTEVFGPVATLVPYRDAAHAQQLIARGQGSLVASLYGSDPKALADAAIELAPLHGRVHVISPDVGALHTGHGNVMPQSLHGGPGRAGGGEELGGLRALNFYHRRAAIQAGTTTLAALA